MTILTISSPQPLEQDVSILREWMAKTPHLVQEKDDEVLRAFITACKGSLQRTKDFYEKFNSLGLVYPHLYGHLDPLNEITQYYINHEYVFPMPKKTDDDSVVIIGACRQKEIDSSKFSIFEMNRYLLMTYIVLAWEHNLGESKFILVFDCQNIKTSELKSVTPTYLKELIVILKKFPFRLERAHFINVPHYFQPMLNFVKSIMSKKLANRIFFHSSMNELRNEICNGLLPKEFGGSADDLDKLHNSWKKKVESYRNRLISENDKMRQLDHLRPKLHDNDGLQGSFRTLQID